MPKSLVGFGILFVVWTFSLVSTARSQSTTSAKSPTAKEQSTTPVDPEELQVHIDGWNRPVPKPLTGQTPAPAARHDISGTWEPANGWRNGRQASGSYNYPSDAKHILPFTPEGEKAWKANKPVTGTTGVPEALVNDPFELCDPIGFPRVELHDLSSLQIVQTPQKVLMVFENDQVWRNIWTDGRDFPKVTEPRWYGYSVGKWVDDTTLVVDTIGLDERTWIDNAGRPHTKDLRVEETFHRVNHDILELTVTIIDPAYYSKPWNGLYKYPLRLQSDSFDIRENVCSASEAADYKKEVGEEAIENKK